MSLICNESCPLDVARVHALKVTEGLNEDEADVNALFRVDRIANSAEKATHTPYDDVMINQSCEISCRALRAMLYSRSVGGDATDVLRLMPELGDEI